MKRVILFISIWITSSVFIGLYSQSRNVVTSGSVERTVIINDNQNSGDIWKQLEQERIEAEKKAEQERLAAEKAEQERLAAEKAEQERLAAEKKAEQERLAAEKKAEQERLAAEKAEQERLAAEKKAEQERLAAEKKAEQERLTKEKREKERIADSIATAQKAHEKAIKTAHRDSVRQARKDRIAAYPWTNIVLFNGAYALYPEYAVGITYARVKQGGFYLSAMMNPAKPILKGDYDADAQGAINGVKPFYLGHHTSTRLSATLGTLIRMKAPVYFYLGAGYGYRGLFYETTDGKLVAWHTPNTIYHGMHWEAGLMGNIKGFGLSLGVSSITDFRNIYYEAKLGIGFCVSKKDKK
ncbi:MAG: cell envelope integrity protein TolA [Paludibacteraceae bacterium]|nr:cell envelope integrity protein TolA [Paludibacteraceae bacterium]